MYALFLSFRFNQPPTNDPEIVGAAAAAAAGGAVLSTFYLLINIIC